MDISPRWSDNTKFIILLAALAAAGFLLYRFQVLIMPLVMSVVLAYLLNPTVTALSRRLRLSRVLAALLLYGILILLLAVLLGGTGLLLQQQLSGMLAAVMAFINGTPDWLGAFAAHPIIIGPLTFDLSTTNSSLLQGALLPTARDWIGQLTQWMTDAASGVAAFLGWTAFVFIIALYLLHDMDALEKSLVQLVPESSRPDARRLMEELGPIWDAFLRGQLLLCLIMGATIGSVTALLGVRYALILGLIATLTEFVPVIGANVIGIIIFFVSFFQPSNWFGLSPIVYAVVVTAIAGTTQQLKGYILIPRIMGDRLRIHPVIMIVGALIGVVLLGLPGLLLSGPIIATLRLFGVYIRAKLFNLPPWPDLEEQRSPGVPAASVRIRPARAADEPDVLDIAARMWDGHDYIPQVWNEWLADRGGILAAAERDGKVVGIGKLSRLTSKEWWIEGLRVHPDFQGMKTGSQIFEYLLGEWTKRGAGVIRLATSSERLPVHNLCSRLGFRRVETFLVMSAAPTDHGECAFEPIAEADVPALLALAKKEVPSTLVNTGWRWGRLTENRVREFVRCGCAWWWKGRDAALLMYDAKNENKPGLEIAAVLSSAGTPAAMLGQARRLAGRMGAARLAWAMPNLPAVAEAAKRAGFKQEWNAQLWVFERSDPQAAQQTPETERIAVGSPAKAGRSRRMVRRPARAGTRRSAQINHGG
jgi:predicted PurR-regulated permease PerM/GNAT superfamily N-acetyltransferase